MVEAPSLMIMAEKDAVLPPSAADGMSDYVHDLEKQLIRDSGHWTQQEKPDEVNRVIIDWMVLVGAVPPERRSRRHRSVSGSQARRVAQCVGVVPSSGARSSCRRGQRLRCRCLAPVEVASTKWGICRNLA